MEYLTTSVDGLPADKRTSSPGSPRTVIQRQRLWRSRCRRQSPLAASCGDPIQAQSADEHHCVGKEHQEKLVVPGGLDTEAVAGINDALQLMPTTTFGRWRLTAVAKNTITRSARNRSASLPQALRANHGGFCNVSGAPPGVGAPLPNPPLSGERARRRCVRSSIIITRRRRSRKFDRWTNRCSAATASMLNMPALPCRRPRDHGAHLCGDQATRRRGRRACQVPRPVGLRPPGDPFSAGEIEQLVAYQINAAITLASYAGHHHYPSCHGTLGNLSRRPLRTLPTRCTGAIRAVDRNLFALTIALQQTGCARPNDAGLRAFSLKSTLTACTERARWCAIQPAREYPTPPEAANAWSYG